MPFKGTRKKNPVTHCPQGHPYDEANTRHLKRNRRACRACEKARYERERAEDLVGFRQRSLARSLSWKRRHPDKVRAAERRQTLRKYRLTTETYAAMLQAQSGVCAICRGEETSRSARRLAVDHDAATGRARGLLCMNCNNGIGRMKHDPQLLIAAADYLTRSVNLT